MYFHTKKVASATSLFEVRPISSVRILGSIFDKKSYLRKLEQIV
jgi:hypothetical protein